MATTGGVAVGSAHRNGADARTGRRTSTRRTGRGLGGQHRQGGDELSILWVDARSHAFSIDLISYNGDITGAWYVIYTNGILAPTQSGWFRLDGTTAWVDGVLDPGFLPSQATAYGIANTIEGPCVFYVVAPWN
jgi:hypothetical protein